MGFGLRATLIHLRSGVQVRTSSLANWCVHPCTVTGQTHCHRTSGDRKLLLFTPQLLRAGGDAHLSVPEAPPRLQLPESVRETPAAAGPAANTLQPGPDPRPVQVGDRRAVSVRFEGRIPTCIF